MAVSKAEKAAYDRVYRERNRDRIRQSKAAYFKRTYDPVAAAKKRKERKPMHIEYCRRPEYKAWKREYDRRRKDSSYGDFAEAYRMLASLWKEIRKQEPSRFERYKQSGRKQWDPITQERRRRKRAEQQSIRL